MKHEVHTADCLRAERRVRARCVMRLATYNTCAGPQENHCVPGLEQGAATGGHGPWCQADLPIFAFPQRPRFPDCHLWCKPYLNLTPLTLSPKPEAKMTPDAETLDPTSLKL